MSGFCRDVDQIWALLGYYAALSGSSVLTFRDNLSVPSSRVNKSSSWAYWPLKMGPIVCPETSVQNYYSTLRNIPEERRSQQAVISSSLTYKGHVLRRVCCKNIEEHSFFRYKDVISPLNRMIKYKLQGCVNNHVTAKLCTSVTFDNTRNLKTNFLWVHYMPSRH
jgi:hypothetical protein